MNDSLGLVATIIGIAPSLVMSVAIEAADIVFMLLGLLVVVLPDSASGPPRQRDPLHSLA
jgi:hypothetical protein